MTLDKEILNLRGNNFFKLIINRGHMFKKLLILAAILSLASCSSLLKSNQEEPAANDDFVIDEAVPQEEAYEPIEDEEAAAALTQETEADVDEEIEVQDRVFFGYDSSDLTAESKKILDTQVLWLESDTSINITIEGHCDERGTREYNIALGDRRANSARNYLVDNGIGADRIKIISYGKEHPVYFGTNEAVVSKNRRAVTVVE